MKIKVIDDIIHQNFIDNHPQKSFFQSLAMVKRREHDNYEVEYLGFYQDNELVGSCAFYKRKIVLNHYYYEAFDGPLLDYDKHLVSGLKALKAYMQKANALRVTINPNLVAYYHNPEHLEKIETNDFKAKQQQIEALDFMYFDVTDSDGHLNWFYKKELSEYGNYSEVFDSFERENKRLINHSLKMPLTIKSLEKDNFKPLIELLAMTAQENNFSIRSEDYYKTLCESFKKYADIEFNVVELDVILYRKQLNDEVLKLETKIAADEGNTSRRAKNRIVQNQDVLKGVKRRLQSLTSIKADTVSIAGGVFLILDNELVYLYGGSNPKYHNFYGAQFLQHQMIKKAYELNIPTYNFYGTRGSFCNRPDEDGVYFFKRGFSGQLIENFGFYIYEPTNFSSKFINQIIKIVRKLR